jgi:hypothetical protein
METFHQRLAMVAFGAGDELGYGFDDAQLAGSAGWRSGTEPARWTDPRGSRPAKECFAPAIRRPSPTTPYPQMRNHSAGATEMLGVRCGIASAID